MTFSERLNDSIRAARQRAAYRNYVHVRERVLRMMDEMQHRHGSLPSDYWAEELTGIDYMFDASPLTVENLRQHCHHLTGIRAYEYRQHHSHQKARFVRKLDMLRAQDDRGLLLAEPPSLGGFGHSIDGSLYNLDTLKFYECLIGLSKAGILKDLPDTAGGKRLILEIGAGWGGFAWQFKTHFPDTTYIIVDLPPVLLFSAVYLKTLFPSACVFMYGDEPLERLLGHWSRYDFIFIPNFAINELNLSDIYLTLNLVSFQEMTSEQVDRYVTYAARCGCQHIYSLNRNRSRHNSQLGSVSSIVSRYYRAREIPVLDIPYVALPTVRSTSAWALSRLATALTGAIKKRARGASPHAYRHISGTLLPTDLRRPVP